MNLDELERLLAQADANQYYVHFDAALRNAARELIADARRYRWLRNEIDRTDMPPLGRVVWKLLNERQSCQWVEFAISTDMDAAIDAAIAKEQK